MGGLPIQPGDKFGRLTAVEIVHRISASGRVRTHWRCQCECGGENVVDSGNLRNGNTRWCKRCSSEYKRQYTTTHGHTSGMPTRAYSIWGKIKSRVLSPSNPRFADYGGRGIDMCPRWAVSFEAFYEDMGDPPTADHQIERVDNNRGYWPDNCVWADRFEQAANKRNNVVISARGETKILAEWSRETGLKERTIAKRLKDGWSAEDALFTPLNGTRRKYKWRTTGRRLRNDNRSRPTFRHSASNRFISVLGIFVSRLEARAVEGGL